MAGLVTYTFPVPGNVPSATPPTAAVMKLNQTLQAEVNFADADTTAVVTHNWGSPLSDLTALFPTIKYYLATAGTAGNPVLTWALTNSNVITITKTAGAGTGGTVVVELERPWSAIR
jgi:hypothetical protein